MKRPTVKYKGSSYEAMPVRYTYSGAVGGGYFFPSVSSSSSKTDRTGSKSLSKEDFITDYNKHRDILKSNKSGYTWSKNAEKNYQDIMSQIGGDETELNEGQWNFENIQGVGSNVPYASIKNQVEWEDKVATGQAKNIGTEKAPLYIPTGSPAALLKESPEKYKAKYGDAGGYDVATTKTQPTGFGESSYKGVSIVDYLKSVGQSSSYSDRAKLAKQYGISDYSGTAEQNTKLLGMFRKGSTGTTGSTGTVGVSEVSNEVEKKTGETIAKDLGINMGDQVYETSDSSRSKERDDAQEKLEDIDEPTVPGFKSTYQTLMSNAGISGIQDDINSKKALKKDLEASLRQGLYDEEGKLRPMELIGTHQQELQRQGLEKIDQIDRDMAVLIDLYNTEIGVIDMQMQLAEMDYNVSVDTYNREFNKQIKMIDLMESEWSQEDKEKNQVATSSKANLNTITKAMTDSGKTWDDLSQEFKTQINNLEIKSGLPLGVTEAFYNQYPDEESVYQTTGTDENGSDFVSFISKDKSGNYSVKNVYTGGKNAGESTTIKFSSDDINRLVATGLSTEDVNNIKNYINNGGSMDDIDGLSDDQKKELNNIMEGITPSQARKIAEDEGDSMEDFKKSINESILGLKDSGISRGDAKDYIYNDYTEGGDKELSKITKDVIEDTLVEVYGRTFWQKAIPFGR